MPSGTNYVRGQDLFHGNNNTTNDPSPEDTRVRSKELWKLVREKRATIVANTRQYRYKKKKRPPYFIDPDSKFKAVWDIIVAVLVMYTTAIVPFRVGFDQKAVGFMYILEMFGDFLFVVDICFNFRTGILDPITGHVRYERSLVAKNYLKTWFTIDVLSTFPFEEIMQMSGSSENSSTFLTAKLIRVSKVLRLVKLLRLRKLSQVFNKAEEGVQISQSLISLVKVICGVLLISHWMACVWFYISTEDVMNSWAAPFSDGTHPYPKTLQYVASLYWSLSTMTTVGYGDIAATNNIERIASIIVMLFSVSVFGYVIGNISGLVENIDATGRMLRERMTVVKEYLITRQVPKNISNRVREHFEYYYGQRSPYNEIQIATELPTSMRADMLLFVMRNFKSKILYLSNCHPHLASEMAFQMHPFFVLPDDNVFVQHEIATHVFFVIRGVIALTKSYSNLSTEATLAVIQPGEHFGELEVFHSRYGRGIRICTATARVYAELTFISRKSIIEISEQWPEVTEYFDRSTENSASMMRKRGSTYLNKSEISARRRSVLGEHALSEPELKKVSMNEDRAKRIIGSAIRKGVSSIKTKKKGNKVLPLSSSEDFNANSIPEASEKHPIDHKLLSTAELNQSAHSEGAMKRGRKLTPLNPSSYTSPGKQFTPLPSVQGESSKAPEPFGNEDKKLIGVDKRDTPNIVGSEQDSLNYKNSSAGSSSPTKSKEKTISRNPNALDQFEDHVRTMESFQCVDRHTSLGNLDVEEQEAIIGSLQQRPLGVANMGSSLTSLESQESVLSLSNEVTLTNNLNAEPHKLTRMGSSRSTRQLTKQIITLHNIGIVHPQASFRTKWDLMLTAAILYSTILVPYRVGFDADPSGILLPLEIMLDVFFFFDILLNFRTAYFNAEREIIYDSPKIAIRYLKGFFIVDFLSTMPIELIGRTLYGDDASLGALRTAKLLKVLRLTRLLKLVRLLRLGTAFGKLKEMIQVNPSVERLIRLLALLVFFGHWNACFFHWIMLTEEENLNKTWCSEYFLPNESEFVYCSKIISLKDRYIAAMYWAFSTMTTVGFGDIVPPQKNIPLMLTAMLSMLVNGTIFGYVITGVMAVINNFDPSAREYFLRINHLKDYVRDNTMQRRLGSRITKHYEYVLSCTSLFPEEELFDHMKPSLRFDVAQLVTGPTILTIPLMCNMERAYRGFISYVMFALQPMLLTRSERVAIEDTPGNKMYFIMSGDCEQRFSTISGARIVSVNFLVEQFAVLAPSNTRYRYQSTITVISSACELYAMSRKDFVALHAISPVMLKHFRYLIAETIDEDEYLRPTEMQRRDLKKVLDSADDLPLHKQTTMNSILTVALTKLREVKRQKKYEI